MSGIISYRGYAMLKKSSSRPIVHRLSARDLRLIQGGFGAGHSSDGKPSQDPPPPTPGG
jgi:hypothetical protein